MTLSPCPYGPIKGGVRGLVDGAEYDGALVAQLLQQLDRFKGCVAVKPTGGFVLLIES